MLFVGKACCGRLGMKNNGDKFGVSEERREDEFDGQEGVIREGNLLPNMRCISSGLLSMAEGASVLKMLSS